MPPKILIYGYIPNLFGDKHHTSTSPSLSHKMSEAATIPHDHVQSKRPCVNRRPSMLRMYLMNRGWGPICKTTTRKGKVGEGEVGVTQYDVMWSSSKSFSGAFAWMRVRTAMSDTKRGNPRT